MVTKRLLLAGVLSFSLLTLGGGRALGAVTYEFCQPDKSLFEKVSEAFKALDIRKTVQNMIASALTDGVSNVISNRNPQQMMVCSYKTLLKKKEEAIRAGVPFLHDDLLNEIRTSCPMVERSSDTCEDFESAYEGFNINGFNSTAYGKTLTSGSLLGLANTVEGLGRNEPLPVNLAYFWNDSISKVPFASKALAADIDYPVPLATAVLAIWKAMRNLAFGLLSVAMLVVGVLIMTRKKLSPQLVVTAQYAIPRIALAVVMIIFSYPLGAVLVSGMNYLAKVVEGFISTASSTLPLNAGSIVGIFFAGLLTIGVGLLSVGVLLVMLFVILVLWIGVYLHAGILALRLLFSIIFAPIIFAVSAIPGNEEMMANWFKKALGNVLGYVGIFAYFRIIDVIINQITRAPSAFDSANVGGFLIIILAPVLLIWMLIQVHKIPGKVNAFVMGEDKKTKRK